MGVQSKDTASGKVINGEIWEQVGLDGIPYKFHGVYTFPDGSFHQQISQTTESSIVIMDEPPIQPPFMTPSSLVLLRPPKTLFKGEITVCVALMLLGICAWVGFAAFFYQNLSMQAAFAFMQHHKALGEDPEFILGAVYGLAQPPEVMVAQWQFQVSVVLVLLLVLGLTWITIRLWKAQSADGSEVHILH